MSRRKRRGKQQGSPSTETNSGDVGPAPETGAEDSDERADSSAPADTGEGDASHAAAESDQTAESNGAAESVRTHGWEDAPRKTHQRSFPVPGDVDEPLRIAVTAGASAEVSDHAKASLDEEVCGVLLGELCQDEHGTWVLAKAAVRGTSAKQGGAHVTYTQDTWEKIYEEKDKKYPKLDIVGWYHSHPGFGVEFSDMDKFIQQNFFSGPTQFALVVDPLGGDEAVCVTDGGDVRYIGRYWIGSKERKCRVPRVETEQPETGAVSAGVEKRLRSVEERLQQLLQASEEDRSTRYGFLLTIGCLAAAACIVWIGTTIYDRLWAAPELAEPFSYREVPVDIDGEPHLLGVTTAIMKLTPRVKAEFLRRQREADAEKFEEILKQRNEEFRKQLEDLKKKYEEAAPQD